MHNYHAAIWIDHSQAKIFSFTSADVEKLVIKDQSPDHHVHHKAGAIGPGHAKDNEHFFHAIAQAVATSGEILIVGPGQAKTALFKHLHHHDPAVAAKVAAVETVDHPSDGQIVAYARKYFHRHDLSTSQTS